MPRHAIPLADPVRRGSYGALLTLAALWGCAGRATSGTVTPQAAGTAEASAPVQVRPQPITDADIHFMNGMIRHHAQAVLMAGWAPTHGAGSAVRALCERIVVGQRDEIRLMQNWLRDHGQPVPTVDPRHDMMPGMDRELMPGMLTAAQLQELDGARGPAFDHLFLKYMIMHHRGAITMVDALVGSYGAAQEDVIFKLASDIHADQTTEINRMSRMLLGLGAGGS